MKKILMVLVMLSFTGSGFAADLIVFSGAGLIKPMEERRAHFEKRNHVDVRVHRMRLNVLVANNTVECLNLQTGDSLFAIIKGANVRIV